MDADAISSWFVIGTSVALAAIPVGYLYGLVAHHAGRPTMPATVLMATGFGATFGTTAALSIGRIQHEPTVQATVDAMVGLAVGAVPIAVLALFGMRRAAAWFAVGLLAPWTLLFGLDLVRLASGENLAPLTTLTAFLGGAIPMTGAVIVGLRPEPLPPPDPLAPAGRPGSHLGGSMAKALLRLARYGPVGPSVVLGMAAGVGTATLGTTILVPLVPFVPGAAVLASVAGAVLGTELEVRWVPAAVRHGAEAFHWIGRDEVGAFRADSGSRVPTTRRTIERWLATVPVTDVTRRYHVELLAFLGRFDAARALAADLPDATPLDRFRRATALADVEWKDGRRAPLRELSELAAAIEPADGHDRLLADGLVAWFTSQARLAELDPAWLGPLATFRERLGPSASGLHATSMRRPTLSTSLVASLAVTLLTLATFAGPAASR